MLQATTEAFGLPQKKTRVSLLAFQVSEEEVKARQEYLKQQRDKLLALKKQVREKRLGDAETEHDAAGDITEKLQQPNSNVFILIKSQRCYLYCPRRQDRLFIASKI